jgi:hypothetical protein
MPASPTAITLDSPAGIPIPLLWAMSGVIAFLWVVIGVYHPVLDLDDNQTLYIYSSASQVIAGVFGLTLAGYVFLRNEQNRLVDRDETLAEIFDIIQGREHDFVLLLSTISSLAILLSLAAIAFSREDRLLLRCGTMNAATAFFVVSIALTTIFIVEALRPGKVVRTSDVIKGAAAAAGSPKARQPATPAELADFHRQYSAIEFTLAHFAAIYLAPSSTPNSPAPRIPLGRVLTLMERQGIIAAELAQEIRALSRYRNAMLHANDTSLDPWMHARLEAARKSVEDAVALYAQKRAA